MEMKEARCMGVGRRDLRMGREVKTDDVDADASGRRSAASGKLTDVFGDGQ